MGTTVISEKQRKANIQQTTVVIIIINESDRVNSRIGVGSGGYVASLSDLLPSCSSDCLCFVAYLVFPVGENHSTAQANKNASRVGTCSCSRSLSLGCVAIVFSLVA